MIGEFLNAIIFDETGQALPPIQMPVDPKMISSFIMGAAAMPKVLFTNTQNKAEIEATAGLITYCNDKEFMKRKLWPVLTPLQQSFLKKKANAWTSYVPAE